MIYDAVLPQDSKISVDLETFCGHFVIGQEREVWNRLIRIKSLDASQSGYRHVAHILSLIENELLEDGDDGDGELSILKGQIPKALHQSALAFP